MLSQAEVSAAGGRFLGVELSRADGESAPAAVALSVDYSGVTKAYGGDFASRLRLVRGVSCAVEAPCPRQAVAGRNDVVDHALVATTVAVRPDPAALVTAPAPDSGFGPQPATDGDASAMTTTSPVVAASGPSGPAGDYRASSLSSAARWDVGVGSGAFTYAYPFNLPPPVAGAAPSLSLSYSSQAVDGRTVSANGQAPTVGEGWSLEPGFIERKFKSCGGTGPNKADLCWSADNEYVLHFGGRTAELVRKTGTDDWRVRGSDPAWRIRIHAGADNADNDGEWFQLVTPDGTKYYFGYGTEPNNGATPLYTSSAYEVPVYGDNDGEPCKRVLLQDSWCQQAYRWNLDRILDTNGNVTTFFYTKERNYYARQATPALAERYVRAGFLKRVEYSQRAGAEATAHTRVLVTTKARCLPEAQPCATPTRSSTPTTYPDVPLDLLCADKLSCPASNDSPTFWSTQQIAAIATEIDYALTPEEWDPVSTYSMDYSFPATADGTSPSLWLKSVTHTGEYGVGSVALPPVRFYGVALPNRVNTGPGVPALNKYRVEHVHTELGADAAVTYGMPNACPLDTEIAWDTNPYDCFPAWYDPQDGTAPGWAPFRKYLVTKLAVADERGGQPTGTTTYDYEGTPAWHYADSLLNRDNQSWSDFRGYSSVRVSQAGSGSSSGRTTRHLLFRGMYGDKLAPTGSKTGAAQQLTDSTGATFDDVQHLAGLPLEVRRYDAAGVHVDSTLHRYWAQQTVAGPQGFQPHDAQYVRESKTTRRVKNTSTGAWREHTVEMTYSPTFGTLSTTSDSGTPGVLYDNTCTKIGYAENTSAWIVDAPYRTWRFDSLCGGGGDVITETHHFYDGNTADLVTAPTKGNVTETRAFSDATAASVTKTGYDSYGRVTSVMNPNESARGAQGKATTTTYSPASGYPHDGITTTTPPPTDTATTGHSSKTVLWLAWGTPRRVTDVGNAVTTTFTVDQLGRTTEVALPDDASGTPSFTFEYKTDIGGNNRIRTDRLLSGSTYVTTYDYLDGLGRVVQRHEPRPNDGETGSRVTTTRYDALGQVAAAAEPFAVDVAPGSALLDVALDQILRETRYAYDALGRATRAARYSYGTSRYATDTTYTGWGSVVHGRTRASGDSPALSDVEQHHDVYGRPDTIVNYDDSGAPITTAYTYTPTGDLAGITDNRGNRTTYTYDRLGRRTSSDDPDQGYWTTAYNPDGSVRSVRDAAQQTVLYGYDRIGRKTSVSTKAGDTAPEVTAATWEYDGLPASKFGVGRLHKATSNDGGVAYETTVSGYDERGRLLGKTVTVPTVGTDLTAPRNRVAGSYSFAYAYNAADLPVAVTMPGVPGVTALSATERVATKYNAAGLPVQLREETDAGVVRQYVYDTTFYNNGDLLGRTMRLAGSDVVKRTFDYDVASGRVDHVVAKTLDAAATTFEDVTYTYDSDQNVTSITDLATGGTDQRECFRHDKLNRLVTAFTTTPTTACATLASSAAGPQPYSHSYTYNDLGDLTGVVTKDPAGTGGPELKTYTYGHHVHAHAVTKVWTGSLPTANTHEYDANGATTKRTSTQGVQGLTWSPLHRLTSVNGLGAATFAYDADGSRLVRDTATSSTLYLDGMEITAETLTNEDGSTRQSKRATRYYGSFATRAARDAEPARLAVLLRNTQNTATTEVESATAVVRQRYTPYGARRGDTRFAATERGFLDKTEDPSGLNHVGARYYDPELGRFLSVDPLTLPYDPQALAAYSYAGNNPTTFVDPTGLVKNDADGAGSLCTSNCETAGTSTPPAPGGPPTNPVPTPTPTPVPPRPPGSGDGRSPLRWGWDTYKQGMHLGAPFVPAGREAVQFIDNAEGCVGGSGWDCFWATTTVVAVAIPVGSALRGAGAARAAAASGSEVSTIPAAAPAASTLSKSARRALRTYERRLAKHQAKLDAYRSDPYSFDNLNILRDAKTPAIRQRIYDQRVKHLEAEIREFEASINRLLNDR